jgi:hypothetical protein
MYSFRIAASSQPCYPGPFGLTDVYPHSSKNKNKKIILKLRLSLLQVSIEHFWRKTAQKGIGRRKKHCGMPSLGIANGIGRREGLQQSSQTGRLEYRTAKRQSILLLII